MKHGYQEMKGRATLEVKGQAALDMLSTTDNVTTGKLLNRLS